MVVLGNLTIQESARYLDISPDYLIDLFLLGKTESVQFESRVFIELDTLMGFDVSKYPARRGR
jgi:hypothetical protein